MLLRATETAVGTDGMLKEFDGWTNKFIFPPYDFGLSNTMVTNFYHPYSTLLMETAAFGGYELVMEAYVSCRLSMVICLDVSAIRY